jgi:IS5 family transposase
LKVVLVDVTESPVERPKRGQRKWYSGKKKRRTIKTQLIVDAKTLTIIACFTDKGRVHDFQMFKKSVNVRIVKHIKIQADCGYQGILKLHRNSETPKKKNKKHPLSKEDKEYNRRIGSERVFIEHVNSWLKRFRILAERYRNRRKRFGLRMSLLCGLHNYALGN